VFLELFVKVREGWRDNVHAVDEAIDWRKQVEALNTRLSDGNEKPESGKTRDRKAKPQKAEAQES